MHSYIQRLVRCPDGRNHQIVIVSIICETAKQAGRQYTKRILPSFVIPECTIRLDLVIQLMEKLAAGDAPVDYDQAYALVGSACERTIDRHLGWARRLLAATVLEAIELLATLAPFGVLPEVSVGVAGLPQLHLTLANLNAARRSAHGAAARPITVGSLLRALQVRVRTRQKPAADFIGSGFTKRLLVRYQLSIPPQGGITWMHYWFAATVWRGLRSNCCSCAAC